MMEVFVIYEVIRDEIGYFAIHAGSSFLVSWQISEVFE